MRLSLKNQAESVTNLLQKQVLASSNGIVEGAFARRILLSTIC
jgi:hypothetical protein